MQAPLWLSKAGVLAEVDELEVVHAQLVDVPGRATLTDTMVLAIDTEVLEALLQCWVCLVTCTHRCDGSGKLRSIAAMLGLPVSCG